MLPTTLVFLAMTLPFDSVLFDFQTADHVPWQVVNDDVMGGRSTSRWLQTNGVAVFQGLVSLKNNGGFASVRSLPARYDLVGCEAFVLRARGDGLRYKFMVRLDQGVDGALYQSAFTTKRDEWEDHRLPLNGFVATYRGRLLPGEPPLDPGKVKSLGLLVSDQQEGPFRLEIAWIKATASADR
jgi:monofunctional biosynthetic peptidoglycan transglycosylase